ncbi:serine-tRNA(Ala) deacylase AlaX [Halopiger goleimassiliensis]|uniref:serine-tRNA(Ala) deacylase AlaX n=1 Tax=Halopiger goleimassiliensis TaxID=1293048 RepID=UPI0006780603|nr:serine-tRNA(Ala) deacylase AlaX [Halopiger goleimassiliensis]
MSGQRAAAEPYVTRFETEVTSVDGRRVWLDRSYFYAESGGQPADRGTIGDVDVVDVQLEDGEPVHYLAAEPSFSVGHRVLCAVDWSFRMYCMRAHTASHVLYGAGRRLFDDLDYAGFDIDEQRIRVDLETDSEIDDETLIDLERRVNRVVWDSQSVSWESVPVAEVREREDVAFNEATEDGAFGKGRVRLVTIGGGDENGADRTTGFGSGTTVAVSSDGGESVTEADAEDVWDVAACGGTHVRNTREIGPISVLGRANPGAGVTRVELAVGPPAIDHRTDEKRAAFDAKRQLGTSLEDVPDDLERVVDERERLADRLEDRERELAIERLRQAEPIDSDGDRLFVADAGDLSTEVAKAAVRERIDAIEGDDTSGNEDESDVVVAVGDVDGTYVVVGAPGERSATTVVDDLADTFGGGGGGSERIAQGGGFDASLEDVRDALE